MPWVTLLRAKLSVHLAYWDMRISAVQIIDPLELLLRMSVGVRVDGAMRPISKRVSGSIKSLVPAHQWCLWYVILSADKIDRATSTIELYGVIPCVNSVRQISLRMCYTIHSDWISFLWLCFGKNHSNGFNRFFLSLRSHIYCKATWIIEWFVRISCTKDALML